MTVRIDGLKKQSRLNLMARDIAGVAPPAPSIVKRRRRAGAISGTIRSGVKMSMVVRRDCRGSVVVTVWVVVRVNMTVVGLGDFRMIVRRLTCGWSRRG
jgi:hypothetical protein